MTVALTGDGGDELFLGYPRYRAVELASWLDRLPWPCRRVLGSTRGSELPAGGTGKSTAAPSGGDSLRSMAACRRHDATSDWIAIFGERARAELYSDDFLAALPDTDPLRFLDAAFGNVHGRDRVTAAVACSIW